MYAPELSRRDPKAPPTGLVLMLHGGTQHSVEPVGERSASWRRAAWMRDQIAGRLHRAGLAVWLLRRVREAAFSGLGILYLVYATRRRATA